MGLFDNREFEYLFQISPPKVICNEIIKIRKQLGKDIKIIDSNYYPHISLGTKKDIGDNAEIIFQKAKLLLYSIQSFSVELIGASNFINPKNATVIVQIKENPGIVNINSILTNSYVQYRKEKPHLTIAKNIALNEFEKVLNNLSQYDYFGEFICESITILRAEIINDVRGRYEKIDDILLKNPVSANS